MAGSDTGALRAHLLRGQVIPAHPLALDAHRRLDERHQRALTRYYTAAGAGGIAVGVHTTQFEIRHPRHGLLAPVLELASLSADEELAHSGSERDFVKIAGICGPTDQALSEARLARGLGYHAGLLSLADWGHATDADILRHCREVASAIPLFGFYLQSAVGGRQLGYGFWRSLAELPELLAIKVAPFDRYRTLDVVRAVTDSCRRDVALYTGNDDNIVVDLLTQFQGTRMVGGLLGHWAVWTRSAVELLAELAAAREEAALDAGWLERAAAITDANSAIFDARNRFAGCIPGIHELLRRQGLVRGNWCLDPAEQMSPGQCDEIDRVTAAYPWMADNDFVAAHIDAWLG